jgi:hypothetical protein
MVALRVVRWEVPVRHEPSHAHATDEGEHGPPMPMPTYLSRYHDGEHLQVWEELRALGPLPRDSALRTEALEVARATMRRVRRNLLTLIERLQTLGYVFGYEQRDPRFVSIPTPELLAEVAPFLRETMRRPPVYQDPPTDIHTLVDTLDAQLGPLPLSLYAWYETIGAVNFAGSFPVADPLDPEYFNDLYQYRMAHVRQGMRGYQRPAHDLEPLWVRPIAYYILALMPYWRPSEGGGEFPFAPSEAERQGFSGTSGATYLHVPSLEADSILWGAHPEEPFVAYLRRVIRWGGFPGLERRTRQPTRELALLTDGLLPV